jgi:poly-gamma-glutamate synthesis protein (capsule biosynthesis protein)
MPESAADWTVNVLATGDVFPDLEDGEASFRPLLPVLAKGDIVFGNCEGVYSDRPAPASTRIVMGAAPSARGSMLGRVGFDVMTLANNHAMDGGVTGLEDTMNLLASQGIVTTGAGRDLAEATTPAVVEANGVRVAFLGFCTSFPVGYDAGEGRAGIAAVRIGTYYRNPMPNFWDPGIDPEVLTVPYPEDMRTLHDAIKAARAAADVVVVAVHQGTNAEVRNAFVPPSRTHTKTWHNIVQDNELDMARDIVEHGADAVVCAQHAALRGIEIYHGKPIFYGMGALIHHFHKRGKHTTSDHKIIEDWDQEYPYWAYDRPETRMSGIASITFSQNGVEAGFIPAMIMPDGSTEPLADDDPRADAVAKHLEQLNSSEAFTTHLEHSKIDGYRFLKITDGL